MQPELARLGLPFRMSSDQETQETLARRLEAMGIEVSAMPGRRCVLARMRLQRSMFETINHPIRIDEVVFATVGPDQAKCLQPRALFQLPILRIRDCRDATAIEARIHLGWQRHLAQLENVEQWLQQLGTDFQVEEDRSLIAFELAGIEPQARARMIDTHRVILPGRGPLRGISLARAEDRILAIDGRIEGSVDLEINVTNRLDELVKLDSRLSSERRMAAIVENEAPTEPRLRKERNPKIGRASCRERV